MLEVLHRESLCGKKDQNQDAYLIKSFANGDMLLVVADGMGGGVMGDLLAQRAVDMMDELFESETSYPLQKLKQSLYTINDELQVLLDNQKGGTTLSAVYYTPSQIYYVNIGDSRIYLCHNDEIVNLTRDQNLYEYKKIHQQDSIDDEKRLVYRILGISSNFEIDEVIEDDIWSAYGSRLLQSGDLLILSTDGFHDYLDSESFCGRFDREFDAILQEIIEHSHDNITALIARKHG